MPRIGEVSTFELPASGPPPRFCKADCNKSRREKAFSEWQSCKHKVATSLKQYKASQPEGLRREMASQIKHRVEPLLGWAFLVGVIAVLGFVLLAVTKPRMDVTGQVPTEVRH